MRTSSRLIAALTAAAFTFVACGIPEEPSVARQAMSSSTLPLTITARLDDPSTLEPQVVTLRVSGVDNGDWNADQRPDSRVNGFHELALTASQPSITRSFSTNAVEDSVSFDLTASLNGPSQEVVSLRLSYHDLQGWHFSLPGQERTRFGAPPLAVPGQLRITTTNKPATLVISQPGLP